MTLSEAIIIVGGAGAVGEEVARRLAVQHPGRVCVAGRGAERARVTAQVIGHGARPLTLDANDPTTWSQLEGAALVLACLDQESVAFPSFCLSRGIHYVDITAETSFLLAIESLHELARAHQASAVVSVGLVPGLSNLLAAAVLARATDARGLHVVVELGLGDQHGVAAIDWTLDHLDAPIVQLHDGEASRTRGFAEAMEWRPPGGRSRRVYRFAFPDQHTLSQTLGVPVSSWFCLTSPAATGLLAGFVRLGGARWVRRPRVRRAVIGALRGVHLGSDRWRVGVQAEGPTSAAAVAEGRRQGLTTAAVAALTCLHVLEGRMPPGVWHLDQVHTLDALWPALAAETGLQIRHDACSPPNSPPR